MCECVSVFGWPGAASVFKVRLRPTASVLMLLIMTLMWSLAQRSSLLIAECLAAPVRKECAMTAANCVCLNSIH